VGLLSPLMWKQELRGAVRRARLGLSRAILDEGCLETVLQAAASCRVSSCHEYTVLNPRVFAQTERRDLCTMDGWFH
jgi:hypothetical protein